MDHLVLWAFFMYFQPGIWLCRFCAVFFDTLFNSIKARIYYRNILSNGIYNAIELDIPRNTVQKCDMKIFLATAVWSVLCKNICFFWNPISLHKILKNLELNGRYLYYWNNSMKCSLQNFRYFFATNALQWIKQRVKIHVVFDLKACCSKH